MRIRFHIFINAIWVDSTDIQLRTAQAYKKIKGNLVARIIL